MNRLIAGPWIGEFGWEIFCWQGYLRAIAPKFESVTIISRPGNQYLYQDFAHEYIEYDTDLLNTTMWINREYSREALKFAQSHVRTGDTWAEPDRIWRNIPRPGGEKLVISLQPQKFIPYTGEPTLNLIDEIEYDIIFHARNRGCYDSGFRNWDKFHADRVAAEFKGYRMASVGLSDSAHLVAGTDDMRNVSLKHLASFISKAKLLVGPMSGPSHFATLCRTLQVIWVTKAIHETRGRDWWNPFETPVYCITASDDVWRGRKYWIPPVEEITELINKALQNEKAISSIPGPG
jgi:hypothetical protein